MTEELLIKRAEEYGHEWGTPTDDSYACCRQGFIDGYHECQKEYEGKCKTAYIKGIRTMANALKDYDKTDGAWTDYFEHTVEKVLNRLLKEIE